MGKQQELSEEDQQKVARAKGTKQDLNTLVQRYNTYVKATNEGVAAGVFKNEEVLSRNHDSSLSVLEGLGGPQFRDHLNSTQKEELVNAIKSTSEAMMSRAETQQDKEKLALSTAKTEASIKGFEFPTSMGGPMMELNWHGLKQDDVEKLFDITKQSLLEASNKNPPIPDNEYPQKVNSLIKEKIPDVFTSDQIEAAGKIVDQGVKSSKRDRVRTQDLQEIDNIATQVSKDFIEILNNNKRSVKAQEIIQETIRNIEEEKGYKVNPGQKEKIESSLVTNLSNSLKEFDSEYIMNNKTDVAKSLSNQVIAQQSIVSKAFGRVKVNEQTLNKINIPDEYLKTTKGLATKPAINKPNTQERKDNIKTAKQRSQAPQPPARKDAPPPRPDRPKTGTAAPKDIPPPLPPIPEAKNPGRDTEAAKQRSQAPQPPARKAAPPPRPDRPKTGAAAPKDTPPPLPPRPEAKNPGRDIEAAKQRSQAPQPPAKKAAPPPQQNTPQKFNQPPANLPPAPPPRNNSATKAILDKRNRELASAAAKAAMPAPIAPMAQAKESLEKPKGRREKFADKVKQTFKNRNNKGRG